MKSIIRGRRKFKYDGSTFFYYNIQNRREEHLTREQLFELGRTLPERVKKVLHRIDLFKVPMTEDEQRDAMLLCSISISCWRGGPNMSIKGVSMEDYTNDFYIQMVKLLNSWNPEKGPWPSYVKWVRLKTLAEVFKRLKITQRNGTEVQNFRSVKEERLSSIDYRSLQELGLQVSEGKRVCTSNLADKYELEDNFTPKA